MAHIYATCHRLSYNIIVLALKLKFLMNHVLYEFVHNHFSHVMRKPTEAACMCRPGVGPGFLERGFICIKVWRVRFAGSISYFSYIMYISHENEIIWSHRDQIISFHWTFKNGRRRGDGGGGVERLWIRHCMHRSRRLISVIVVTA